MHSFLNKSNLKLMSELCSKQLFEIFIKNCDICQRACNDIAYGTWQRLLQEISEAFDKSKIKSFFTYFTENHINLMLIILPEVVIVNKSLWTYLRGVVAAAHDESGCERLRPYPTTQDTTVSD